MKVSLAGLVAACALAWAGSALAAERPVGDGAWSWFGDPRAVTNDGRTYVGWGRPAGGCQSQLVRPRHWRARDRGSPGASEPGRSREPLSAGPARRSSRRLLLAARRPDHALPRVLAARGRQLLGRAANRAHEHAGHPRIHVPEPDQAGNESATYLFWRGGNYNPTFSIQNDGETSWSPARTLITMPGRAPLREVRLERRRHDPRGLHERPPERVREREHLLRACKGRGRSSARAASRMARLTTRSPRRRATSSTTAPSRRGCTTWRSTRRATR